MISIIKGWGIPEELKERNVDFVFNSDEISDTINALKKQYDKDYYKDLHCRDGSVKFCLYDFNSSEILFTMDFFEGRNFSKDRNCFCSYYIQLQILYVNDPRLRSKGIATYYLKKLLEYAAEDNISSIKVYVNPNDKLFKSKKNALSKKQLEDFYNKISNDQVAIEVS